MTDLEIREAARKLVAGTYGRGAWETPLPAVTVGAPDVARGVYFAVLRAGDETVSRRVVLAR